MDYPENASKVWVIIPKFSGTLSMIGSGLILRDVYNRRNNNSNDSGGGSINFVSLIMVTLSVGDFGASFFAHFLGSWMVPKGLTFWAAGNVATCTAQGVLATLFGNLTVLSSINLALIYVLMVRYGWKERDFRRNSWFRWIILGYPLVLGIIFNIPILLDEAYNFTGLFQCYIAASPLGCDIIDPSGESCDRGPNAQYLSKWWSTVPLMVENLFVIGLVFVLFLTVFFTERQTDRYLSAGQGRNRKQTIRTGWQGIWYVGAFVMTYIPWYILMGLQYKGRILPPYWLLVWTVTVIGLQGFFNALVYFRPTYVSLRDNNYNRRESVSLVLGMSSKESIDLARSERMSSWTPGATGRSSANTATSSSRGTSSSAIMDNNQGSIVMPYDKSVKTITNDDDNVENDDNEVEGKNNSITAPGNVVETTNTKKAVNAEDDDDEEENRT